MMEQTIKVVELIIQVIVFREAFYVMSTLLNKEPLSLKEFLINLLPVNYFVILYGVLYIISPYINILLTMNAIMGKLVTPMKIDISTGDVITSRAIEYKYKLLLDDRSISLWSYNLETILAEKLQTVLARGLLNTRMRDFYDIKTLLSIYEQDIDTDVLNKAFEATCKKRSTENLKEEAPKIMAAVSDDAQLHTTLEVLSEEISVCGWYQL